MVESRRKKDEAQDAAAAGKAGRGGAGDPAQAATAGAKAAAGAAAAEAAARAGAQEPVGEAPVPSPDDTAASLARERDQYLDHLQRLKAEFENYRKRMQRDNEALVLRAGEGVIESLLPVVDNMRRALEAAEKHEEGQLIKGVELVAGQLTAILASHGLGEVPAERGLPFDPTIHEAVMTQPDDLPEGLIAAVVDRGFTLHDRLLRPAKVIVTA